MIHVREIKLSDASNWLDLLIQLDEESPFLLFEKGERKRNPVSAENFLCAVEKGKAIVYVAETQDGRLVGYICGNTRQPHKQSKTMDISLGVLKKYQKGVGVRLSLQLLEHSKRIGIRRLEATIIKENKMCLNLCKRFGVIEGIKRDSVYINGVFHDEIIMGYIHE